MQNCDVAIIGAGPYGLSLAAHLKPAGVSFRIFGEPMGFWLHHMPKGMHLKSEGFASSLFEPRGTFTLKIYCRERGISYADLGIPVPLEVFTSYGLEFQRRFVPGLETEKVLSVQRAHSNFRVMLENGETFIARKVVVAVGQSYYSYIPKELDGLPPDLVTHSSAHSVLDHFAGLDVAVVGAGASALDMAALLHEAGAEVTVVARIEKLRYHDSVENSDPSWLDRLREPVTGIGPGWKLWLCANLPTVFRLLPEQFRVEKVRRILGPAPCWFIREQVEGKVQFELGVSIAKASAEKNRVSLQLVGSSGSNKTITADRVIAATGFRTDIRKLQFLDTEILDGLKCVDTSPALSSQFESSVQGLYFIGVSAANTFGPLLRFAVGAGFAAPRLSRHLTRTAGSSKSSNNRQTSESRNQSAETIVH
jgi:thioredoxin reductase